MMDPYLLAAVIREESRFDPKAISRAGAMGLMQVIPSTWKWISKQLHKIEIQNPKSEFRTLNSELRTDSDPFDPRENISRGSRYLRYLFDKFNRNLIIALSAYNAGPETVNSWLTNRSVELDEFIEEIPYKETKAYLKRVLRSYGEYQRIYNCSAKIDSQREFSCL
jgi:soluble lytic murein transglycosylase